MEIFNLWENAPGLCLEVPTIEDYIPKVKMSDAAVIIFPGGAYRGRAQHEGDGYARFLNEHGITTFVANYRVAPHTFPLQLLDARRCVRWVRANAEKYGIDPERIAVMGSSAGGHLAALLSTYTKSIDFENADTIDQEDYMPNAQILCYPVIEQPGTESVSHTGSYKYLIGREDPEMESALNPAKNVTANTPEAFIWHTDADQGVSVVNSYIYATALHQNHVPVEMHVFPDGRHGLGLAPALPHTAQWSNLLIKWLNRLGWLDWISTRI